MQSDDLVPACGGTETPFTVNGRRWIYCWQPSTGRHCYLDLDTDIAVWNRSFHPAYAPELEFDQEQDINTHRDALDKWPSLYF